MKRFVFVFLVIIFLFINCLPTTSIFADSGYTDSQLADIGTLMLTNLIASGEATELDFSDYTENEGLDFLISLGELAVSGDPSGLIDQGFTWLGGELSDAYDSLIESIREWEFEVAPDLYNWWYQGTDYEYKLVPAQNVSRPLNDLFRSPDSTPSPDPDIDYQDYLDRMNKRELQNRYFSFYNVLQTYSTNSTLRYPTTDYSWIICSGNFPNTTGLSDRTASVYCSNIIDLYIYSNESVYYLNTSVNYLDNVFKSGNNYYRSGYWSYRQNQYRPFGDVYNETSQTFSSSGTLAQVLEFCCNKFKNVNVYVDNVLWSYVGNAPTYPIVIPNILTVLNDLPAQYTFSEPTYLDLTGLKTLITNAINSSDILTWQDIDDYFLDVNGVQALPTINIIRNDYDNMYIEQYPYPAALIGFNDPLKFNEHMLDNVSGQYLNPMVNVTKNTVNVLPSELKWVLGIGAILSIFALIINRLLE